MSKTNWPLKTVAWSLIAGVVVGHYATLYLQDCIREYNRKVVMEAARRVPAPDALTAEQRQSLQLLYSVQDKMQEMQLPMASAPTMIQNDEVAMLINGVK